MNRFLELKSLALPNKTSSQGRPGVLNSEGVCPSVRGVGRSLSWKEPPGQSRRGAPFEVVHIGSRNSHAVLPCLDGTVHLPKLMRACAVSERIGGVGAWITVCS
jgi:hypothetical protein